MKALSIIMTKLTQKILKLDSQIYTELKTSNELAHEAMMKADTHAIKIMSDAQQLFNEQKEKKLDILSKELDKKRIVSEKTLKKNMQYFDENFDIDELVERLILVAKEKVCY